MTKHIFIFLLLVLQMGCKDQDLTPVDNVVVPSAVSLIFPFENSECNEGTDITETESTVLFEWISGENTDEYELMLTNLSTGQQSSFITPEEKIPIVLQQATPYAWFVTSRSSETDSTAHSDTWKFYNTGVGISSYAPFPAEILFPSMSETVSPGTVTLNWNGEDVDGDIVKYNLFFGTSNPPELYQENITDSQVSNVSISSDNIYYWQVITIDAKGHSSSSNVFQFKVE